jgi:NADH dehydrogenase (ubiquinone) flavoprotein 1
MYLTGPSHCSTSLQQQVEGRTKGDAVVWPIQGLMRQLCLEVERRITEFCAREGSVLFGGRLACDVDPTLTIPNDLGGQRC